MFNGKKVIHIVACGNNGEIGKDNDLLWRISEDLKFFKESTLGHVVLMGRKTFESLPKPLERRMLVKVSRTLSINIDKWLTWSVDQGCDLLNTDCIFIAGGGQIYKATEPCVDEVWLTEVFESFEADTFYTLPEGLVVYEETPIVQCVNKKTGKFVGVRWSKLKKVTK